MHARSPRPTRRSHGLARKTGAGALKRPVLVALGIRADGKKEIIDRRESAAALPTGLYRRASAMNAVEVISADGRQGLSAALPTVYPGIPLQRCWAHKIRNILDKVRKADQDAVKDGLHAIMNAPNRPRARSAARRFADTWENTYPKAVACLRNDLDELLTCFRHCQSNARTRPCLSPVERGDVRVYVSVGKGVLPVVEQRPRAGAPRCHSMLQRLRVYRWPSRW